jgi:hypothetical protein
MTCCSQRPPPPQAQARCCFASAGRQLRHDMGVDGSDSHLTSFTRRIVLAGVLTVSANVVALAVACVYSLKPRDVARGVLLDVSHSGLASSHASHVGRSYLVDRLKRRLLLLRHLGAGSTVQAADESSRRVAKRMVVVPA